MVCAATAEALARTIDPTKTIKVCFSHRADPRGFTWAGLPDFLNPV